MYASSRASTSTFGGLNSAVAGNGVASAQEQASADLVLLQQNLAKSKRVTTRMTALLTSFDDRLARLDKSVVPIHRSTRDLSKVQRNVEAALLAIDSVLGTNDLVDREQEIIDRLPDRDGLGVYQASLTRLKAALDSMEKVAASAGAGGGSGNNNGGAAALAGMKGKEKETTLGRVRDLIEMGCERIGGLFLETVEMVSPKTGWPDITAWDQGTPFPALIPQDTDDFLKSQLSFIQTILSKDSPLERDLQKGYGDIRGVYMAATLNQVGREAVDGVEVQTRAGSLAAARMPAFGRRVFGRFLDAMFAIAKSEHSLAGVIFEKHMANQIHKYMVPSILTIFTATGTAINAAIKKTLTTNATSVGIAYTCYTEMTLPNRIDTFEDWIRSKSGRKENELSQLCHAFKASCLRALPEFLEETRKFGIKVLTPQEQINAAINPAIINIVNFAKQICDFPDTVENFLQTLGDGNWLPGGTSTTKRPSVSADASEFALLAKYLADVIQALFQALDARTKAMAGVRTREGGGAGGGSMNSSVLQKSSNKDNQYSSATSRQSSALSAIFMLNNIAYVRRELLMNSNVPDLLASGNNGISSSNRRDSTSTSATGPGGGGSGIGGDAGIEDELNKRNRLAKSNYLEIFSPLVSCLMDAGTEQSMLNLKNAIGVGGNSEKKDTKDRFIRFNESLDEIENIHKVSRLDKNESDLRERVKDEVVRMCVPTYTAFVKRHDGFSKNPSKYLRVDPAGFETRLKALFEPISKSERVMGRV